MDKRRQSTIEEIERALRLIFDTLKHQQALIEKLAPPEEPNPTSTFKPKPRRIGLLRRVK